MNNILGRLDPSTWKEYRKSLVDARSQLGHGKPIGSVLPMVRQIASYGLSFVSDRLDDISSSYNLMCDYLLKGYKDDHREGLYQQLACRLDRVIGDMLMYVTARFDNSISAYISVASQQELNIDDLRHSLEAFVSDAAMLSLEPDDKQNDEAKAIYDKRQNLLQSAFNRIVGSPQWTSEVSIDMRQLLVSPTIDSVDALTLTSAIMLSALLVPDAWKLSTLAGIYSLASDNKLKQRSLVGWVFALSVTDLSLYPAVRKQIETMLKDADVCGELLQLQMQVIYCMNAERDNEMIKKDVMPTIMNNQNLEISRYGIREKEEDPMDDILHPDEADRKMEDMEKSIRKMVDMQKQGADIYFGGFSKMKRFGFFYTLSNWFTPFYKQHPQLRNLSKEMLDAGIMDAIFRVGPFCESDKYSFALGMSSIYGRLPKNIREMVANGDASMHVMGESADNDNESVVYIRRQYLQDLYRFFRLNDCRHAFSDPFAENGNHLFMAESIYRKYLGVEARRMERFALKHKRLDDVRALIAEYFDSESADDLSVKARLEMLDHKYDEAEALYARAFGKKQDDLSVLKGYAQASFYAGHFDIATEQYRRLAERQPQKTLYRLNLAISLINADKADEGVKVLYELYYNYPDDIDVKRALAWGQLCLKHLEQAGKLYDEILSADNKTAADYLNAGYCKWFSNDLTSAVSLFGEYKKEAERHLQKGQSIDFMRKLSEDASLLDIYGVAEVDRRIIAGMVN